jgi:hypothetical protein
LAGFGAGIVVTGAVAMAAGFAEIFGAGPAGVGGPGLGAGAAVPEAGAVEEDIDGFDSPVLGLGLAFALLFECGARGLSGTMITWPTPTPIKRPRQITHDVTAAAILKVPLSRFNVSIIFSDSAELFPNPAGGGANRYPLSSPLRRFPLFPISA